jgi:hypothetical protein
MSDEEATVLICAATGWGARPSLISGAAQGTCHDCGQPVWIAPSGLELIAQHNAITVCGPCGLKSIQDNPDTEIGELTERQKQELRDVLEGGRPSS